MIKASQKIGVGQAHSKFILIGEHAVVYGEPAIAIPFPLVNVTAEINYRPGPVEFVSNFYSGAIRDIPVKLEGLAKCVEAVCQHLQHATQDFQIELISSIPIGRGLGSSAAIAVALVRSLYDFFQKKLERSDLMQFVDLAEKYAHGTPSGIDMEATSSDQPIWFEKNKPIQSVEIDQPLHFIVADTGRIGDTHAAVASIKQKYEAEVDQTKARINRLAELTDQAKMMLKNGQAVELGIILNQAHEQLRALGVSDPGLDHYVEVSNNAGALGAKLTGGGRGGCIIALAPSLEVATEIEAALIRESAAQTWLCTIGEVMKS
ncbi:mevalonate kinase [Natronobacillus azotifigens]|uniref:mevalonate kinase n=1 Tax=Natronobacillus azotifigens TaxID=472978 RepID=A0A9J6RF55_9BACI|nr:mevalonate kinase [Natronobacillus azotifigens]MCZ0704386.1 mevalonate kinase [Natronobacillus azotifigens]